MSLAELLYPYDPAVFLSEFWERQPLLLQDRGADRYAGLFSLADVDRILSSPALLRQSGLRLVQDGKSRSYDQVGRGNMRGDRAAVESVLALHAAGATISMQAVNRMFPPLADLCRELGAQLSATLQANVYLTPPSSQGFDTHADTHDVFVLQVSGVKRWNVFDAPTLLPLPTDRSHVADSTGTPVLDVELRPGDLLYVPRGFPHHAVSTDAASLHLTVGVHTIIWGALLHTAVAAAVERDPRLRASVPVGFAGSQTARQAAIDGLSALLRSLADGVDTAAVVDNAAAQVRSSQRAALPGRLLDLDDARAITGATRVRRRTDIDAAVSGDGDRVGVRFDDRILTVPAFAQEELRHLLTGEECSADELPGTVDAEGRLVLIRRLLREGILTISR